MNLMHRISQVFATLCVALFARSALLGYVKEQQALKFENEDFSSRLHSADTKEAMRSLRSACRTSTPSAAIAARVGVLIATVLSIIPSGSGSVVQRSTRGL